MKYEKPSLTLGQQADLLLSRGMAGDRNLMVERLGSVNYYRLSGYWHPFVDSKEQFEEGTSFETVWARYAFDRRLRLVVMDAIERVEIAIRTWLAYHHSQSYGPFAYATDPTTLSKLTARSRQDFLNRIKQETDRSKEDFVSHFRHKYGDSSDFLPGNDQQGEESRFFGAWHSTQRASLMASDSQLRPQHLCAPWKAMESRPRSKAGHTLGREVSRVARSGEDREFTSFRSSKSLPVLSQASSPSKWLAGQTESAPFRVA